MSKDLGVSTSYAYYVAEGGTKTPQEYGEMLVNIDTVATRAEDAADSAAESATGALNSKNAAQTAATTATNKASEATTAATTATTKAGEASTSASTATSAKDTAVSASQTATTKATEATTAAATAVSAKDDAVSANTAAQSAKTAAQTAQTGAETAAASVQSSAAQIATNAEDISQLKSDLNDIINDTMTVEQETSSTTPTYTTTSGYIKEDGTVTASDSYVYTNKIDVNEGDVITCGTGYSFRFVTAYDEFGNAVSASGASSVNTYTVPQGITGVIISFSSSWTAMVITVTSSSTSYSITGLSALAEDISNIKDVLETERDSFDVQFIVPTYSEHEMNTSGTVGPSASYKHTEKISVQQGDFIFIYKDNMTESAFINHNYAMRYVTAFSGDTVVSASGGNNVKTYTVPEGIDGIVVSVSTSNSSQEYEQQVRIQRSVKEKYSNSYNILNNKKWVACGDSFTAAGYTNADGYAFNYYTFASGRFAGHNKTYPWIIGLRNNMDIVNMAVSGMSMALYAENANSFVLNNYYQSIPADADYITLKFGINDVNHGSQLGTIDSTDPTTFYGAWNIVMDYITTNFPYAKVGIIVSNGMSNNFTFVDATIAIAKKWGIPYLDEVYDTKVPLLHRVNRPDVSAEVLQKKLEAFRVSASNTHPNVNAQYYEATFVEDWLRTL